MESIETVAQNIEDNVIIVSHMEMICNELGIYLEASPLYNFRDALSHYILRYEATDDDVKTSQEASINEHIFRGTKDIYVFILYEIKQRVSSALRSANYREQGQDFRRLLHEYKKLEIEIRRNTESTVIRSLTPFVENLDKLIEDTKKVFEKHGITF